MPRIMLALVLAILPALTAAAPVSGTSIEAACYSACEAQTQSNVEYKACLGHAAEAADARLNEAYGALKAAVRGWAKEMGQSPDGVLGSLTGAQKRWIAYRDANCTFEDELAFGGTATGGNQAACLCAVSLERAADFARIRRQLLPE